MTRVTLPSPFPAQVPTLALASPNAERVDLLKWLSVDFKELALPMTARGGIVAVGS